jgi:isoleucyl-tRNA synthetase
VAKLQVYCSEELGAFYLDVLKDRLYTTAPKSLARRSAQTALWNITHAMLRWMAPFLSFTAEEAWKVFGTSESIFLEEYAEIGSPDTELLAKWERLRAIRDFVNKSIEDLRTEGKVGSSLQANVTIRAGESDLALLRALGDDLKFVFITSKATVAPLGDGQGELAVEVVASDGTKCERCWHWRHDVGSDAAHPAICGRCAATISGRGDGNNEHGRFA